jgi:hypothetical protein
MPIVSKSLYYDGTVKPLNKIAVGDVLMGPDSTPRHVTSLSHGTSDLFLARKIAAQRLQVKDVLVTGIEVTPIGKGAFYGFSVDGDYLFLLGDFTVAHGYHGLVDGFLPPAIDYRGILAPGIGAV